MAGPAGITGCVGWYKADALGLADGAAVTSWTDEAGGGRHLTQATTASKPTYQTNELNGLPVVRFDGADDLLACGSSFAFAHAFIVAKYDGATFGNFPGLLTGTTSAVMVIGLSGGKVFYNDGDGSVYHLNGNAFPETLQVAPLTSFGVCSVSKSPSWNTAPQLGRDRDNAGRNWLGDIAEVILYDSVLSPADRASVENYLYSKYGLGRPAAVAPGAISGLVGHFKADSLGLADESAVTSWPDQSGAGHTLTGGSPTYQTAELNGLPIVRFDGVDDYLAASFMLNQPMTWFALLKWRSAITGAETALIGTTSDTRLYRTDVNSMDLYGGAANLGVAITPEDWHTYGWVFNGAASSLQVDNLPSMNGNPGSNPAGGIRVGSYNSGVQWSDIDVAEVVVYNRALTTTERVQIEAYLYQKWFVASPVAPARRLRMVV